MTRLTLAGGIAVVAVGGCSAIAGLRDLQYTTDASTPCKAPTLPSTGAGHVRVANLSTKVANADFCVRPSGASGWGTSVFADGGPGCQPGLAYAQVTIPFAVQAGKVDVKAISAGGSCDSAPLAQVTDVPVGAGSSASTVTLALMGKTGAERIAALPEEPELSTGGVLVRVVNALSGWGSVSSINVGLASASAIPATIDAPLLPAPIFPGHVATPNESAGPLGIIDAYGYANTINLGYPLGVVFSGTINAVVVFDAPSTPDQLTLFTIGDPSDSAHPLRGLACHEVAMPSPGTPLLADCALTQLPSLGIDTLNTSLYGADAPFESDRRPAIMQAIAARTTDLACILEVPRASDKQAIAAAASPQFPYTYWPETDLTTPPTDPATADGGMPMAPAAPPCSGVNPADIANIYQCVAQNCSDDHAADGGIETTKCLTGPCLFQFAALYKTGVAQDRCFDCILAYLISESPISEGQAACTQSSQQPLGFDGANPSMILSHYPLQKTESYVLPSSFVRRSVLKAEVELGHQSIDFYCAQLTSPLLESLLPYTGSYGQDMTIALPDGGQEIVNGWEQEQDLQVRDAIDFIQKTSAASGNPAIIAGDWHASAQALAADGGLVVGNQSQEVMAALDQAFVRAEPAGYEAQCEYCPAPENVYNGSLQPFDFTHTFLRGLPAQSVTEDQLWGTSNAAVTLSTSIPYESPPAATGPITEYYPRVVYVLRPSPPQ